MIFLTNIRYDDDDDDDDDDDSTIAGGAQLSDWLSQETMRLHLRVHRPPE